MQKPQVTLEKYLEACLSPIREDIKTVLKGVAELRQEIKESHLDHEERIKELEKFKDNLNGRLWALGVGLGIVVILANYLVRFMG